MEEIIKEIIKKNTKVSESTSIFKVTNTDTEKIARESYEEGRKAENERLEKKAREYKEKGFELETFIYSGFIDSLPKITENNI